MTYRNENHRRVFQKSNCKNKSKECYSAVKGLSYLLREDGTEMLPHDDDRTFELILCTFS